MECNPYKLSAQIPHQEPVSISSADKRFHARNSNPMMENQMEVGFRVQGLLSGRAQDRSNKRHQRQRLLSKYPSNCWVAPKGLTLSYRCKVILTPIPIMYDISMI